MRGTHLGEEPAFRPIALASLISIGGHNVPVALTLRRPSMAPVVLSGEGLPSLSTPASSGWRIQVTRKMSDYDLLPFIVPKEVDAQAEPIVSRVGPPTQMAIKHLP